MLNSFSFPNTLIRLIARAFWAALVAAGGQIGFAAISLSTSTTYTQNFDGMGTAASATMPADFRVDKPAAVRTVGTFAAALTATSLAGGANLSSSASNGIYNFGSGTTTTGPDRAVGFLSSGTATQSGNLYAQLVNNTGATLTGLQLSYGVEKYRLGINPAGFRIQLFYSLDGSTWTNAGASFLTSFPQDGGTVNSGFSTAPGATVNVNSQNLSVAIPDGSNFYLAWNYSVTSGTTTTNGQALAIDDISILGLSNAPTNPTGTGAANPSTVQAGSSTLLTVAVTPGANPASTGIAVSADLTSIGGSATQQFFDDGTNGDVTAGDNVFSFQATVPMATTAGTKTLPAWITDAQSRSGTASISLMVTPFATPPTGTTAANPNSLMAGATTLLTVTVTPGANPISTGIAVSADLTAIGGSTQQFFDDGTHGDMTAGDNVFSFAATVGAAVFPGAKSLPVTVSDAQSRSSSTLISLTVQSPPAPTTVKISQAYGGGGNSGSTYKNDFIEIFNQAATPIDVSTWSVQYATAGQSNWSVTPLCAAPPCTIGPGRYFLVKESQGLGGTTDLPTADATGTITMGAGSAQVALVDSTAVLTGICPTGGTIVDFVGYGTSGCPNPMSSALSNTTGAIRKGNGCIDTDNAHNDFLIDGPIPRNSSAPPNSCSSDPAQIAGLGIASPDSIENTAMTLLTVKVAPANTPPSTNLTVTADVSALGGSASQQFYDDGTHGDVTAGDNTFSVLTTIGAAIPTGAKYLFAHVTDGQGRSADVPITVSVQSPTCGVEYWNVKTGTDADAASINLSNVTSTTISDLRSILIAFPPIGDRPTVNNAATRISPTEFTVYQVHATLTLYKLETDVDYHMVLQDENGNTIVAEVPSPACVGAMSPFLTGITNSRAKVDARLSPTDGFQSANLPIQVTGVGFFDVLHGQTGVAPNGIELHPILDLSFTNQSATLLASGLNPSMFGQAVTFTATVSNGGISTPTGNVTFLDGATTLGTAALDTGGQAMFTTSTLATGPHTIGASYEGDNKSTPSKSDALVQTVNKADQAISFAALPDKTYGDPAFAVSATGGGSGNPVTFGATGNCTSGGTNGATITITGAGSCTVTASQSGNSNYNDATPVSRAFNINRAAAHVTATGFTGTYDGAAHGALVTASGIAGEDLSSLLTVGPSFINVPGGTANWSFAGNTNYAPAAGSVAIVILKATPAFSKLTSTAFGALPITISGTISLGALIPTGSVGIILDWVAQNAAIQANGTFSTSFSRVGLPNPIIFNYGGDNNFNAITASLSFQQGTSSLWIGLKNSDDQGTNFDLRADLVINGTVVATGVTRCITGVTRNPDLAKQAAVSLLSAGIAPHSGDVLTFNVMTRIGTNADGTKCAGHSNAVGLDLYYDSSTRSSGFDIAPGSDSPFYLHSTSTDFLDNTTPVTQSPKSKNSPAISFSGGNPWVQIGSWSRTQP